MRYRASDPRFNPSHDVMPMFAHFIFLTSLGYIVLDIKEYPVFKPNDYFWEHHWDPNGKEAKWEVFARVIRNLIASSFDLKLVKKFYFVTFYIIERLENGRQRKI